LPTPLRRVGTNSEDTRLFKFTRFIRNPVVKDAVFQPPELKGWTVVDLSLPEPSPARPLPPPVFSEVAPR
jgi:hypothetical protein